MPIISQRIELPFRLPNEDTRLAPGVIVADTTWTIRSLNVAACRLFGNQQNELIGKKINVLMPKAVADQHEKILHHYCENWLKWALFSMWALGCAHFVWSLENTSGRPVSGENCVFLPAAPGTPMNALTRLSIS